MNTIRIYLAESGRIADLKKDFPLYQGAFQNKLLNIFVPLSITEPNFRDKIPNAQAYIGEMVGSALPTDSELETFVQSKVNRAPQDGDYVVFKLQVVDTPTPTYYEYVYNVSDWTQYLLRSGELSDFGTSVQISMSALQPNGIVKESAPHLVRYLKNITKDGVTYALYERMLPQDFTAFSGQGANAPILTINVVVVDNRTEPAQIMRVTTSQTCRLDVMPSTTTYDKDATQNADDITQIGAQLSEITQTDLRQDREIDENRRQIASAAGASIKLQEQVDKNTSDIAAIQSGGYSQTYIGSLSGAELPTDTRLDTFVQDTAGRAPENGDFVLYTQVLSDTTDKIFQYFFSLKGWQHYEIPPMEAASNTGFGIIKGNTDFTSGANVLVSIINGEITEIYTKDKNNVYKTISSQLDGFKDNVADIVSGKTTVGVALKAVSDELGNNIVNTYLTQNAGVTKTFLEEYALPKVFYDAYYITSAPPYFIPTPPTNKADEKQFSVISTAVGESTLFNIFNAANVDTEISSQNAAKVTLWVAADRDCTAELTLFLTAKNDSGLAQLLVAERATPTKFEANTPVKVVFDSTFSQLGDAKIPLLKSQNAGIAVRLDIWATESTTTTFSLYSGETFASTYKMDVLVHKILVEQGYLGEIPEYNAVGALSGNLLTFSLVGDVTNKTLAKFNLTFANGANLPDTTTVQLLHNGQAVRLATPYNWESGAATLGNLRQTNVVQNAVDGLKISLLGYVSYSTTDEITVQVQMDDLDTFAENIRGKITEVAFNAILQSGTITGTLDETVADFEFSPNTNYRINIHLPLSTLTGALDNDYKVRLQDKNGNPLFVNCILQPAVGETSTVGDLCQIQQYITTIGYTWTFTALYRELAQGSTTVRLLYTEDVIRESARAMTGAEITAALVASSLASGTVILCTSDYNQYKVGHIYRIKTNIVQGLLNLTAEDISLTSYDVADSEEIVWDRQPNKILVAHLQQDVHNRIERALVTPMAKPTSTILVGVDNTGAQVNVKLGENLTLENGSLNATGGAGTSASAIPTATVDAIAQEVFGV